MNEFLFWHYFFSCCINVEDFYCTCELILELKIKIFICENWEMCVRYNTCLLALFVVFEYLFTDGFLSACIILGTRCFNIDFLESNVNWFCWFLFCIQLLSIDWIGYWVCLQLNWLSPTYQKICEGIHLVDLSLFWLLFIFKTNRKKQKKTRKTLIDDE